MPASIPSYSSGTLGPLKFQVMKGWLGPSLWRETNKAIELKWAKNNGMPKSPALVDGCSHFYAETAPTGASASSLLTCGWSPKLELHGGRAHSHVEDNVVHRVKSRQLRLGGSCPAIKYHWPRWGSGNWRDKEGNRRRWVSLQNPTSSSVRMTILRDEGVGCLFSS